MHWHIYELQHDISGNPLLVAPRVCKCGAEEPPYSASGVRRQP
jgi:hypothetical protein